MATMSDVFVKANISVNGIIPGKPVIAPVKTKESVENGNDPAFYIVCRLNGPSERFLNGEAARKAYRVLGGVGLVRVNKNGVEVELEVR